MSASAVNGHAKEEWITLKEAIYELRPIQESTVRRLVESTDPITKKPYLRSRHPGPRQVQIERGSIEQFKRDIEDPEFWPRRLAIRRVLGFRSI